MMRTAQDTRNEKEVDPLDPEYWSREWEKAAKASSLARKQFDEDSWTDFWSHVSKNYLLRIQSESKIVKEIISLLLSEGAIARESVVLDIGCGPGTFTLPLARMVARVFALDPARKMLDTLLDEAQHQGLSNITPLCQKWEESCFKREFDLTLASFSPAIRNVENLLKMQQASRGYCCLITSSGSENFRMRNELWELVLGKPFLSSAYHIIYPFNYLYSCGFRPHLRFLKSSVCYEEPVDTLIDWYENYFKMFVELDAVKRKIIRHYFENLTMDGMVKTQTERTISIMWWGVDR